MFLKLPPAGRRSRVCTWPVLLGLLLACASVQAEERLPARILCHKATAPVDLDLVVLAGGHPGERSTIALIGRPADAGGRLDLELVVPESVTVLEGGTADSGGSEGSPRLLQVELQLPLQGLHQLIGKARWSLPGGQVWSRGVVLQLPLGVSQAPTSPLPLRSQPGGGALVEFPGEARP